MFPTRSMFTSCRTILRQVRKPLDVQRRSSHHEHYPAPFSNVPFTVKNRYTATAFFSVFFGLGLWAPFLIVWYQMAKRSM